MLVESRRRVRTKAVVRFDLFHSRQEVKRLNESSITAHIPSATLRSWLDYSQQKAYSLPLARFASRPWHLAALIVIQVQLYVQFGFSYPSEEATRHEGRELEVEE